jgi:cytochrome c553
MKRSPARTVLFVAALVSLSTAMANAIDPNATLSNAAARRNARVERGAYLVKTMGCNDCHTPWKLGPRGPEPDMTRALTGHPADFVIAEIPKPPAAPWAWMAAATNTAFAGPWGVSFTANLTPDPETGLGKWTEDMFIAALRTGRHEGKGRPIMPPMPWPMIGQLADEDLKSVFAYLQSLPPVKNRVPSPLDPPESQ